MNRFVARTPVFVAAALALLAGSAVSAQSAQSAAPATRVAAAQTKPADALAVELRRYMSIRTPGNASIAPDGTIYVRDWPDGIFQLYRRPAGSDPTAPKQRLTDIKDGLDGYSISPDGTSILLLADAGGNENTQVWKLDPATDAITPVLQNGRVQHSPSRWLRDSSGFLYRANADSPRDFHLYRFDFATGKSTSILAREGSWSAADITQDASRALVTRGISASQSEIYELDLKTGNLRDLSLRLPDGTLAANSLVGYLPGETQILVESDVEEGQSRLFLIDLATGNRSKPLPKLDQFELDSAGISHDRDLLTVSINEDGYSTLSIYKINISGGALALTPVKLPPMEKGLVGVADIQGKTILYTQNNARTPGLTFSIDINPDGSTTAPRQITAADTQGIDLSRFALPELIKYTSFDGREIPAFVYLPPGAERGRPVPFVVNYHGGPEAQTRPGFTREIQFLLSRGFGVMQPNVRGSTGYGRAFQMLDDYKGRWDSVKDGVEAARWLVKNQYATPGKIATWGGSYGGFMSVACLVEDGRSSQPVFGAGINIVGIVNFVTFLQQTADYRRKLREVEYGPLTDKEFLVSVSPLTHLDEINVPVFIAHGLNDPRVPVGEALQLDIALQRKGLEPELLIFPDEGHGFSKLQNRLLFTERMVRFLERTIGGE